MSWCDKLASVPSVGLKLTANYSTAEAILLAMRPKLNEWMNGEKPDFNVQINDAFQVVVQHNNGFHYVIDPQRVTVVFQHRMRLQPTSGGLPIAELISKPKPYSDLLQEAATEVLDLAASLPGIEARKVDRIGVVSSTNVDEEMLPPGIGRLLAFMKRPWDGNSPTFNMSITGVISATDTYEDRCVHTLSKNEGDAELTGLNFDWQRVFKQPQAFETKNASKELARATKSAVAYFESLGEGSRFDYEILSSSS